MRELTRWEAMERIAEVYGFECNVNDYGQAGINIKWQEDQAFKNERYYSKGLVVVYKGHNTFKYYFRIRGNESEIR